MYLNLRLSWKWFHNAKKNLNHLFDFRLKERPRHFFVKFTLSVFHWPQRWALHSDPQVREAPAVSCQQQPVTCYVHDLTKRIFRMNGGRSLQWHFLWVDYPLFVWKVANKTNRSLWIWNSFIMLCLGQRGRLIAAFAVMLRPVQVCSTLKDRYQSEHVFNGMCEGDCIDVLNFKEGCVEPDSSRSGLTVKCSGLRVQTMSTFIRQGPKWNGELMDYQLNETLVCVCGKQDKLIHSSAFNCFSGVFFTNWQNLHQILKYYYT